ncbi:MAG: hypothetical protein NC392_03475 [Roseburia sp.]|nr:hypothetical protein [Roseburia sp.]
MLRLSDNIKNYTGPNPFSDSQARNFSDIKVVNEFYPISQFWTLFNDQHEILVGTRGSGKTFLLKMMRYSMLKELKDPKAQKLVTDKEFIAIYVPMHLEFVVSFNDPQLSEEEQIILFQFGFNCKLAEALITELKAMLNDIQDAVERAKKIASIVECLNRIWFEDQNSELYDFEKLSERIIEMYYSFDWRNADISKFPTVFKRQICAPLLATKLEIKRLLNLKQEPTWIVCIDEAEFLNKRLQKCINNIFRSDSNRIALKVATLPYYHKTLETLVANVSVTDGNDFSFRVVDLDYNSEDFISLTNKLCSHRLKKIFNEKIDCPDLESFLGKIGNDDQIDYYRQEFGEDKSKREIIEQSIIDNFSPKRKENAINYENKRKTIYDKYAPILFVREMYNLTKKGHYKPGWYAGAKNIRKLSQGNPRVYIQIMSDLFDKAKKTFLSSKVQHEVVINFAKKFCEETQALEERGPIIYKELNKIANYLHEKVHNGYLKTTGSSFVLEYQTSENYEECKEWIELAVAYSRVVVDDEVKICGIKEDTKFNLSNLYAMAYWLPLRSDSPEKILISQNETNIYIVENKKKTEQDWQQLSLFDEVSDD